MANRSENRYAVPGGGDLSQWLAGNPFFLSSALKYIWRGWDEVDDLRKAIKCLEIVEKMELDAPFNYGDMKEKVNYLWTEDKTHMPTKYYPILALFRKDHMTRRSLLIAVSLLSDRIKYLEHADDV